MIATLHFLLGLTRLFAHLAIGTATIALMATNGLAQACPGDCDGDGQVRVNELITGVNIALGAVGVDACRAFDVNGDGRVAVSELVGAVNAALEGCANTTITMIVEGLCMVPARDGQPGDEQGLVPCAAGTLVIGLTCRNAARCLEEDEREVYRGPVGPDGRFTARIELRPGDAGRVLFKAEVANGVVYRRIYAGPVSDVAVSSTGAGGRIDVVLSPVSEAAVQILSEEGLANFSTQGILVVASAVDDANEQIEFDGLDAEAAAALAVQIAREDPAVQDAIDMTRFGIACDEIALREITNPAEIVELAFPASSQEIVRISVSSRSGTRFEPEWRLVDDQGVPAVACGNMSTAPERDCGPLAAGVYRILVADEFRDGTGTFGAHMQRLTVSAACEGLYLSCGVSVTGQLSTRPRESDLYQFDASAGEVVYVETKNNGQSLNYEPDWRLLDAAGRPSLLDCATFVRGGKNCQLPASGTYSIEVRGLSGRNIAPGTAIYSLHMQRLRSGFTCNAQPLECDIGERGTLVDLTDNHLWGFDGVSGEAVTITLANDGADADWRLLNPDGHPVVCGSSADFSDLPRRGCRLMSDGRYHLQVRVRPRNSARTGAYLVHMNRTSVDRTCDLTPAPCGGSLEGQIGLRFVNNLHSVILESSSTPRIAISRTSGAFQPEWFLLNADGSSAARCGTSRTAEIENCGPLAAGTYQILVQARSQQGTGTYAVGYELGAGTCPAP